LFYLVLTLIFLWPLPANFGRKVIQTGGDVWAHLWWCWWIRKAVVTGTSPLSTPSFVSVQTP